MKFFTFLLFIIHLAAFGQDPYYLSIDKTNGLPSNHVYDVYQDSKNFIWYATSEGVCRLNGIQIIQYTSENFPSKPVSNIQEDFLGRIWYQDFNGNIYYIENENTFKFDKSKANGFLRYYFLNEHLFIATKDGISIYNLKNLKLYKTIKTDLKDVKQTVVYNNKFYLIGKKITGYDINGNKSEIKLPEEHSENNVAPITLVYQNDLLIFSKFNNYYYLIKDDKVTVKKTPIESKFIQNIIAIDHQIWICTTNGVYSYNTIDESYQFYFSGINISSVLKTKYNKYWFTTLNNGIFQVNNIESKLFKTNNIPHRIVNFNDNIYLGTTKDEVFNFSPEKTIKKIYDQGTNHFVNSIYVNEKEDFIAVASSQLFIKAKNKTYKSPISVKEIVKIDHKYYMIAATSWSGIIYVDKNLKSEFDSYFKNLPEKEENGIYFKTIVEIENGKSCTYDYKTNTLFYVTNYGIRYFKNNKIGNIKINNNQNFNKITATNHGIYVTDEDEILYTIEPNLELKKCVFKEPFKNSGIARIRNHYNELFLIKNDGIFSYVGPNSKVIKVLDISNNIDFIDITKYKDTYYIAINEGIITTKSLINYSEKINLHIRDILVNSKSVDQNDLSNLNYNQNNIEIKFDIATETISSNYKLFYKINENPWENLNKASLSLKLSSMSYGDHKVLLKLVNDKTIITKEINLKISHPFWYQWWFVIIVSAISCALLYAYFKYQIKRINKRNQLNIEKIKLEKYLNQSKIKALKSQMNPHFFFNALNTLQSYILDNDKTNAILYLSKFSKLTRAILEMSDKEYVNLEDEINTLKIYLEIEQSRFSGDFYYDFIIDDSLKIKEFFIPSLLLQPYVENAIKHGLLHKEGKKEIIISFKNNNDFILITIDDNGIGRKKSSELNAIKNQNHKSFATESLLERIELINMNLKKKISLEYIDKENYKGTTVIINIPKRKY